MLLRGKGTEYDCFLFDCDGVLVRGSEPLPHAKELLLALKTAGKRVFFITNNSILGRLEMATKLNTILKVDHITHESVLTAAFILARHVGRSVKEESGQVLVVGMKGLMEEIAAHTPFEAVHVRDYSGSANGPFVAVALGLDRSFDYACLTSAMTVLQKYNCPLFACNLDASLPAGDGSLLPGTGSIVRAVEHASRKVAVVVGKPNGYLFEELVALHPTDFNVERTVMVGDCLDIDIAFAKKHGIASILVETGVHKRHDLCKYPDLEPDRILSNLSELLH